MLQLSLLSDKVIEIDMLFFLSRLISYLAVVIGIA